MVQHQPKMLMMEKVSPLCHRDPWLLRSSCFLLCYLWEVPGDGGGEAAVWWSQASTVPRASCVQSKWILEQLEEIGTRIIPILQMRRLRLTWEKHHTHGHTAQGVNSLCCTKIHASHHCTMQLLKGFFLEELMLTSVAGVFESTCW